MNNTTTFNEFLSTQLNSEQATAVRHKEGSLLVVAGAGSGKTRVITARITHLILNEGIPAESIVALTFTNKAADEMKERIKKFLGESPRLPFVGTFHSYCLKLLKENPKLTGMETFSIMDEDDQKKIVSGIIERNNLGKQTNAKQLLYQISQVKNRSLQPEDREQWFMMNPMLEEIFAAYEKERAQSNCLDFDDLLLETLKLFTKYPAFKEQFQQRIRHILVDEYQDTNVVQHALLKQMALHNKKLAIDSICVVGDEDQSIYSWRGATVANIMNFKHDFGNTQTVTIEQNYRSVQPILDVANQVIQHNTLRNPKQLWSERKGSDRIRALQCMSEYHESDIIIQYIKTAKNSRQKLSSIAILYRTHFQSRALEEALIKHSIPYKIIGGIQFYERKEIKDMLAYLRLMVNPLDRPSLFRVINCPQRGLGAKFEEQFYERWNLEPFLNFSQVAHALSTEHAVSGAKKDALMQFVNLFESVKKENKPSIAVQTVITETGYLDYLKKNHDPEEAQERIDNLKELVNALKHLEEHKKVETIEQFLHEVALMQEKMSKQNEEHDTVLMMTLHAAKGLEFDTVILSGLEDGLLPSSRSIHEDAALEEERRLFYVGITRAKERLLLSHARYRYSFGQMTDQLPSRFLKEIPKRLVAVEDASYWREPQQREFFNTWLGWNAEAPKVMTFGAAAREPHKKPSMRATPAYKTKPTFAGKTNQIKTSLSSSNDKTSNSSWKKNQPVKHAKFGVGIVQECEERSNGKIFVTAKFKEGTKKIDAQFLETI